MKHRLFLLCSFLFVLTTMDAQKELSNNYSYNVSEPYKVIDGDKQYFHYDKSMVAIKRDRKNLYIQRFDTQSLNEITRTEYKISDILPNNFYPEGIYKFNDICYYFYSSWSGKKTKHERLYYLTIDLKSGKIVGEPIKIIDVSGKIARLSPSLVSQFWVGMGYGNKFDFLVSKNESKMLIQYRKNPKIKNDTQNNDIIGINVFDATMNELWSKEYRMPYTERRLNTLDYAIDSNGNGYILTKVFHDDSNKNKKKKKDKEANYHIELFRLLKGNDEIQKTKIALNEKFINGISLFETNDGNMNCSGYYNKGELDKGGFFIKEVQEKNADGLFFFKISKDGELSDAKFFEIPADLINQYVSDKTKKKNDKKEKEDKSELTSMVLRDIFINNDGSYVLIGEQYYVKYNTYVNSKGAIRESFSYHYNNMLISKIDTQGNLAWIKKLPKRQTGSQGLGGMSYSYFYTNDNHYIVYLDNVKNFNLPLDKKPALHKDGQGGYLTAYKVADTSGDVSKGNILDTRNLTDKIEAHQFKTDRLLKIEEDMFIIEVYKKKKEDVLIKVKIKN